MYGNTESVTSFVLPLNTWFEYKIILDYSPRRWNVYYKYGEMTDWEYLDHLIWNGDTPRDYTLTGNFYIGRGFGAPYSVSPFSMGEIDLSAFRIYVNDTLTYTPLVKPNYTLPNLEEVNLVDSSVSGINSQMKEANLILKQTGSAVENTAVTFQVPFRDTNYSLSIPYVAGTKTTTGFTPSRDGDWIAEGYATRLNYT